MSQENVEIVSEMVDAFNRRDLDGYLARIRPDVEWDVSEGFLGVQDVYRGWAGVRKWWNDFLEAWESFDVEVEQITEGSEGRVFVGINGKGRGKASRVETELPFLFVFWVADHKVARLRMFQSRDEALEAAGLREQAMSQENVELIRRAIEAWNRADVDGWLDQATPDFVWIPAGPAAVERSVYRGRDEVREAMAGGWETWQEFRFEESEIRSLGESVVWLGRVHATGRASEVELDQEFAIHAVVRDGKLARTEGFLSRADALEAAGLSV